MEDGIGELQVLTFLAAAVAEVQLGCRIGTESFCGANLVHDRYLCFQESRHGVNRRVAKMLAQFCRKASGKIGGRSENHDFRMSVIADGSM